MLLVLPSTKTAMAMAMGAAMATVTMKVQESIECGKQKNY
jgi:hypothetical protein